MKTCPACKRTNRDHFKYCVKCGTLLQAEAPRLGVRGEPSHAPIRRATPSVGRGVSQRADIRQRRAETPKRLGLLLVAFAAIAVVAAAVAGGVIVSRSSGQGGSSNHGVVADKRTPVPTTDRSGGAATAESKAPTAKPADDETSIVDKILSGSIRTGSHVEVEGKVTSTFTLPLTDFAAYMINDGSATILVVRDFAPPGKGSRVRVSGTIVDTDEVVSAVAEFDVSAYIAKQIMSMAGWSGPVVVLED